MQGRFAPVQHPSRAGPRASCNRLLLSYDADFHASAFSRAADGIALYDVRAAGSAPFELCPPAPLWRHQATAVSRKCSSAKSMLEAGSQPTMKPFSVDVSRLGQREGRMTSRASRHSSAVLPQ